MNWFKCFTRSNRDIAVLCLLGSILWLTSSGMWDLRGPDEGRYVQIAKELLTRDNSLYLTVHGVPYDQKPPLAFWLFALMLKLNGGEVSSWIVRFPSVMAAIATVIMTYLMGRHSFGRRAGFFAGLILMTSPLFFDNAPAAELNMLFTAAITGALCLWITRTGNGQTMSGLRVMGFWACLAAAFFIKGPLALVIVFSVVGWGAWTARSWTILRVIRPLAGIFGLVALIDGWLYFQSEIYGAAFVREQVSGETLNRLMAGDHTEPFWYYLPRIFSSTLFPWSLLTIPAAIAYLATPRHLRQSLTTTPFLLGSCFHFCFCASLTGNGRITSFR